MTIPVSYIIDLVDRSAGNGSRSKPEGAVSDINRSRKRCELVFKRDAEAFAVCVGITSKIRVVKLIKTRFRLNEG
ncbi:hypothetical protein FGB62_95g070 [Gracilaria domingensis]|nr:hypothetical protein FGB62_95g070 [Gracilaria domingensis]